MRIISGYRDSHGVPMEPDEEIPCGYDWAGEPIYPGMEYYDTDAGKIPVEYLDTFLGPIKEAGYYE